MRYLAYAISFCAFCCVPISCFKSIRDIVVERDKQPRLVSLRHDTAVGGKQVILFRDTLIGGEK